MLQNLIKSTTREQHNVWRAAIKRSKNEEEASKANKIIVGLVECVREKQKRSDTQNAELFPPSNVSYLNKHTHAFYSRE